MFENHPGFEEAPILGIPEARVVTDTSISVEACPGEDRCWFVVLNVSVL